MVETASGTKNGLFFDALDDPKTMIRVNDLVTDFKCHVSPCQEARYGRTELLPSSPSSIAHDDPKDNGNGRKMGVS